MLIKRLSLKKILSFTDTEIELGPLNVLIGANAAGKSNLIEVISLLQSAPTNILAPIARGGGPGQWINLGRDIPGTGATIECEIAEPDQVRYRLQFYDQAAAFSILEESLTSSVSGESYFQRSQNTLTLGTFDGTTTGFLPSLHESFLAQFRDPFDRTPISRTGRALSRIRIYREFRTNQASGARSGVSTQAEGDSLADGGDNLAMVLQELHLLGKTDRVNDYLRRFCERFENVKVAIRQGSARLYLEETGLTDKISSYRMSDGTLKFLCLLGVLLQPSDSQLVCIEEPEVGLHPDAMQMVAEVLLEASQRMQIIVTTHSEALVDALSDDPERVMVCERGFDDGTQMRRLERDKLKDWLEHYRLGQLWRKGEIGGNRW
jgi:predicted ATPase